MTGADEAGGGVEVVGGAGDSDTGLDAGSSVPGVPAERCGHVLLPEHAILVARALSRSSACNSDPESVVACTETVFCEQQAWLVLRALCQGRLQRHFWGVLQPGQGRPFGQHRGSFSWSCCTCNTRLMQQ